MLRLTKIFILFVFSTVLCCEAYLTLPQAFLRQKESKFFPLTVGALKE